MTDATDYLAEDYRFTRNLLRKYAFGKGQDTALFRAVCSNNLNIILAALEHAEAVAPHEAPDEADDILDDGIPVISKHGDRETI